MSKHPIQAIDDLFKVAGMEFGLMAEKMNEETIRLVARAEEVAAEDRDGD